MQMSLAWIDTQQIIHALPIIDEFRKIADAYKHAFETRELTEIDSLQCEKAELLLQKAMMIQQTAPIIAAQRKYKNEQSKRASKPRKLTVDENKRIAKQYLESKRDGEGYGAVKALAAKYDVSETTIHNIVKKHKTEMN